VYWLSELETKSQDPEDQGSSKYTAHWSLPAKVKQVKDKVCIVIPWGDSHGERQVPVSNIRKLEGLVPPTLQETNVRMLENVQPRTIRHWSLRKDPAPIVKEWTEVINDAKQGSTAIKTTNVPCKATKRARTTEPEEETNASIRQEDIGV